MANRADRSFPRTSPCRRRQGRLFSPSNLRAQDLYRTFFRINSTVQAHAVIMLKHVSVLRVSMLRAFQVPTEPTRLNYCSEMHTEGAFVVGATSKLPLPHCLWLTRNSRGVKRQIYADEYSR